jgi:hypothetical protein
VDKRGRVKIADFGLAKLLGQTAADARLTRSNLQMGTPHYMAPEQMEKPLSVDHRADIYSLGVVFYELLTGELPLGRFAPPSQKVQVDVRLDEIVLRSMEHDVERRYQHVSEVKTDVENLTQSSPPSAASKPPSRRKLLVGTSATVALLLAAGWFAFGHRFFGKPSPAVPAAPVVATPESHFNYATDHGTITITKYTGSGGAVTIPNTINGLPVTSIKNEAFFNCSNLTSITIPNSITSIGIDAFLGCSKLTSVVIPASVTNIGVNAFHRCNRLNSILVDVLNPAYSSSADGVVFNKEKTRLVRCPGAKAGSYVIPNSVTSIADCAFNYCTNLTSVMIPNSVTNIEIGAFGFCSGLTSISVDAANPAYINSADGVVFNKEKNCLVCYPGGKVGDYVIPNSVTSIGNEAFMGCSRLTSVTIPDSVTSIGFYAFQGCSGLTSVAIPATVTTIDNCTFRDCTNLTNVTIPNGVVRVGWAEFCGCTSLTNLIFPSSVTSIGEYAFVGCASLTGVYFKGNAPSLGGGVFDGDSKATVYYQPGAKGWGPEFGGRPTAPWNPQAMNANTPAATPPPPFNCTTNNGTITITKYTGPGGDVSIPSAINGLPVTSIQEWAFNSCENVTSVTIPKSVTSMEGKSIGYRRKLTSITVDPANPAFSSSKDGVLFNKDKTKLVLYPTGKTGDYEIPNGVTTIGEGAFNNCAGLVGVTIPDSVTSIGGQVFGLCAGLTKVRIPKSVTSIADNPFPGCSGLISIEVDAENPVFSSKDGVWFDKTTSKLICYPAGKAGSYEIPDGVTEICAGAFQGFTNLTNVTIPASVRHIGGWAFWQCTGLNSIYFKGNAPSGGSDSPFAGANNATVYYLPGTTGWGKEFGGRPTAPWNPQAK